MSRIDMELPERTFPNYQNPNWPDNVLKRILGQLPFEEQKRVRFVSKKWNDSVQLIHPKLRERIWVTDVNYEDELTKLSTNPRCQQIDFVSLTKTLQLPPTSSFEHIERIGFHGTVMYPALISVLHRCPGLRSLYLEDVKLPGKMFPNVNLNFIKLPNLREMGIKCAWTSRCFATTFSSDDEKLLDFLARLDYGDLQTFECYFSNLILDNLDTSSLFIESAKTQPKLFNLILKNKSSLVNLALGDPKQPLLLTLATEFNANDGKPLQLESIIGIYNIPPHFDIMFRVQYNLRALKMNNSLNAFWFINITISQCAESITKIHLAGTGQFGIFDFSVIASCKNLQDLSLLFTDCLLSPFPNLPENLRSLNLCGPITDETLQQIIQRQLNLESFILEDNLPMKNFPSEIVAEVDAGLVETFMLLPKLTTLSFRKCVIFERDNIIKWCNQYDNVRVFDLLKNNQQQQREGLLIERRFP